MRRKSKAPVIALCGVLAALAVALMFLGGTVAFAVIACPVLASLVLIPVYCECGWKWGLLWYAAVSAARAGKGSGDTLRIFWLLPHAEEVFRQNPQPRP